MVVVIGVVVVIGALALLAVEDRELTRIALVTLAFSRDQFAGDAVRPISLDVRAELLLLFGWHAGGDDADSPCASVTCAVLST